MQAYLQQKSAGEKKFTSALTEIPASCFLFLKLDPGLTSDGKPIFK